MSEKTHAEVEALRQLQTILRKVMNDHQDALVNTPARDYADYRYRVGLIHGFAMAERELLDLDDQIIES